MAKNIEILMCSIPGYASNLKFSQSCVWSNYAPASNPLQQRLRDGDGILLLFTQQRSYQHVADDNKPTKGS